MSKKKHNPEHRVQGGNCQYTCNSGTFKLTPKSDEYARMYDDYNNSLKLGQADFSEGIQCELPSDWGWNFSETEDYSVEYGEEEHQGMTMGRRKKPESSVEKTNEANFNKEVGGTNQREYKLSNGPGNDKLKSPKSGQGFSGGYSHFSEQEMEDMDAKFAELCASYSASKEDFLNMINRGNKNNENIDPTGAAKRERNWKNEMLKHDGKPRNIIDNSMM